MKAWPPGEMAPQLNRPDAKGSAGGAGGRKFGALAAGLLIGALSLSSPAGAGLICVNDRQRPDAVICPPPDGELVITRQGDEVCGIGWCTEDSAGKIRCSKVPGGAAIVDQKGNSLCVGGCMEAREDLCHRLKLPRF